MIHHKKPRNGPHKSYSKKMIEEDKGYHDIVQQVSAIRTALDDMTQVIIEDLVEYSVSQTTD
jgi:DNA-binding FrmR family transcriptional regulator